jgi:hypothetical protein
MSDSACGALRGPFLKKHCNGGRISWSNGIISSVAPAKTLEYIKDQQILSYLRTYRPVAVSSCAIRNS